MSLCAPERKTQSDWKTEDMHSGASERAWLAPLLPFFLNPAEGEVMWEDETLCDRWAVPAFDLSSGGLALVIAASERRGLCGAHGQDNGLQSDLQPLGLRAARYHSPISAQAHQRLDYKAIWRTHRGLHLQEVLGVLLKPNSPWSCNDYHNLCNWEKV